MESAQPLILALISVLVVLLTAYLYGARSLAAACAALAAGGALAAFALARPRPQPRGATGGAEAPAFAWETLGDDIYEYFTGDFGEYAFVNFRATRDGPEVRLRVHTRDQDPSFLCQSMGCPEWEDINCDDEQTLGALVVKTACNPQGKGERYARGDRHRELKVFVQGFRDFAAYIAALKSGRVSRADNAKLWGLLKADWASLGTAEFDLINHNLDVNILHFKYGRR